MISMRLGGRAWLSALSILVCLALAGNVGAEPRVVVDTEAGTLTVLEGDSVIERFEDIAIGRFGKTYYKRKGDGKTPLGYFRIGWIKEDSQFHYFLGFDYPNEATGRRALEEGIISEKQWQAIERASRLGKTPPQNTPLGGMIGIHGLGAGDIEIHRQYNWTRGCIAVTNAEMERLMQNVGVGTWVEVR